MSVLLVMYAVRNKSGHYFRNKGYGGYGETWVESLEKARIYPRPGPARAQVTYFANNYPQFGVPELVELHVTEVVAMDETVRVEKSMQRKARQEAVYEESQARWRQEAATRKLKEAQDELDRLKAVEERRASRKNTKGAA